MDDFIKKKEKKKKKHKFRKKKTYLDVLGLNF